MWPGGSVLGAGLLVLVIVWRCRNIRRPLFDNHTGAQVAEECLEKANDLSGLLLLHSARGSVGGLGAVVAKAEAAGRLNVAFLGQLLLGRLDACVDLLLAAGRIPEAAFFARTYLPSRISEARHLAVLYRG